MNSYNSFTESEKTILNTLKTILSRQNTIWGVLRNVYLKINGLSVWKFVDVLRSMARTFASEKFCHFLFSDLDPQEQPQDSLQLPMELSRSGVLFFEREKMLMYSSLKEVFCTKVGEDEFDDFICHLRVCKSQDTVYHCIMYFLQTHPQMAELRIWNKTVTLEQLCSLTEGEKDAYNYRNLHSRIHTWMTSGK